MTGFVKMASVCSVAAIIALGAAVPCIVGSALVLRLAIPACGARREEPRITAPPGAPPAPTADQWAFVNAGPKSDHSAE